MASITQESREMYLYNDEVMTFTVTDKDTQTTKYETICNGPCTITMLVDYINNEVD